MEYLRFRRGAQQVGQVLAVGVGDEYLSEAVAVDESHYPRHALRVQFVEDVVQQQDKYKACASFIDNR